MKTKRIALFSALFVTALFAASCSKVEWRSGDGDKRVHLQSGETHEGWYFAAGNRVVIDGTVNGDAYVAGGRVTMNGKINGDLIVAGGDVDIEGPVSEHIRVAGGTVNINDTVGKDITVAGGTLIIGKDAVITGNVLSAGGTTKIHGTVLKSVKAASGDMEILGSVTGDVDFAGGTLNVTHAGAIGGNLHAYVKKSHENVTLADSAVRGDVTVEIDMKKSGESCGNNCCGRVWGGVFWFLSLLVSGLVLLLIAPVTFGKVGESILKRPGHTLLWGLVMLVMIPVVSVMLMITILGIPVAFLLLMLYVVLLYCSQLALGIAVGRRLMGMEGKRGFHLFLAFAVGLAIVCALELIPIVRPILIIAGFIIGTGAIILTINEMRTQAKS